MQRIKEIAAEALALLGSGRQVRPFSERYPDFTMAEAYAAVEELRVLRMARGEVPVGRKIGFTNRTIWPVYNVTGPMWSYMYEGTVRPASAAFPLAGLAEPRIEPEIAFRLARAPEPGMGAEAIMGCVEAVAHGFEIVDSPFPGWKFTAPDSAAAHGLHAALLLGAWRELDAVLEFSVTLTGPGGRWQGHSSHVLGGPLEALGFLAAEIARHGGRPLEAGEIVTTGTLTDAMPIRPGETWTTQLEGIALPGLSVTFG